MRQTKPTQPKNQPKSQPKLSPDQLATKNEMLKVMLARAPIGVPQDPRFAKMESDYAKLKTNNDLQQQYFLSLRNSNDQEKLRKKEYKENERQFKVEKREDQLKQQHDDKMDRLNNEKEDYRRKNEVMNKDEEIRQLEEEVKKLRRVIGEV